MKFTATPTLIGLFFTGCELSDVVDKSSETLDSEEVLDTQYEPPTDAETHTEDTEETDTEEPLPAGPIGLLCAEDEVLVGATVVPVGTFDPTNPGTNSMAFGLNDAGQVTGFSEGGDHSAYLWSGVPAEALTAIHDPLVADTMQAIQGYSVNDLGAVAGQGSHRWMSGWASTGFYWSASSGLVPMGEPGFTSAEGLNNLGVVAGGHRGPMLWDGPTGDVILDLTLTDASIRGRFRAINDTNVAAGQASSTGSLAQPIVWSETTGMITLPTAGGNYGDARAINAAGYVVTESQDANGTSRCQLHDPADYVGPATDLGHLTTVPGNPNCRVEGINDRGEVVGTDLSFGSTGAQRAWVWKDGTKYDLNGFLTIVQQDEWTLRLALAINEHGVIVGSGAHSGVQTRAFSFRPVCEPL